MIKTEKASFRWRSCCFSFKAYVVVAATGKQEFDKAFVTLFHITGGDPWPELGSVSEDG